jgi:hypothetical protein
MKEAYKIRARAILVALAACMLSDPQTLLAQKPRVLRQPPPSSSEPRVSDIRGDAPGVAALESSRRDETPETAAMLLRRVRTAELTEDFERLGRINREKILPLSRSSSFDHKELSDVAREINKRARRIKYNSPLLPNERIEKTNYDSVELGSLLSELSRRIDSFLGNSIFRVTSINDGELRSAAGRDLEGIIRLSDTINRIARRLAKA